MSEPSVPPPPVTLQEMAAWLREPTYATNEPEKDWLQVSLDSAIEQVEARCGPIMSAARTFTPRPRRHRLVLPETRLVNVQEVRDPDGNLVEPYDIDLLCGIVELAAEPPTTKRWTVVATTRDTVASLQLAVKIIASHLFEVHRGGAALPTGRAYATGDSEPPPAGFALPRRAEQLMAPFRRTMR